MKLTRTISLLFFISVLIFLLSCQKEGNPVAAVEPIKDIEMFEDHSEALVAWMKQGYRDMVLIHVDHHSDIEYLPERKIKELQELSKKRRWDEILKHKDIGDGLYSLADFIYPAYRLGIIKRLYWVTTVDLFWSNNPGPVVRAYLRTNEYSDDMIDTFQIDGNKATGEIYGLRTTVSTLKDLPEINEPVLLSIDVDYFSNILKESRINELAVIYDFFKIMRRKRIEVMNMDITYSVNGGYTAITDKHIGDELVYVFNHPEIINSWNIPAIWKIRDEGFYLLRNNRIDEAFHFFDENLAQLPDEPTLLLGKAISLCYKGKDDDSFDVISRLLERNPEYDPVYIYLGKALARKKEVPSSKRYIHEYLKRHPELYSFMKSQSDDTH